MLSSEHGMSITVMNSKYLWLPAQDLHNIGLVNKILMNEEGPEIPIFLSPCRVII